VAMGGSFEEAFLKKWLYCSLVRDLYKLDLNSELIPQIGGTPSCHAFWDLVLGTKSDLLRLYMTNPKSTLNQLFLLSLSRCVKDDFSVPALAMRPEIRVKQDLLDQRDRLSRFIDPIIKKIGEIAGEEVNEALSLITMSSEKHIVNGLIRYYKLYQEQSYTSSLMYETKTRMICRSMFATSQKCMRVLDKFVRPRDINGMINILLKQMDKGVLELFDEAVSISQLDQEVKKIENKQLPDLYEKMKDKWSNFISNMFSESINVWQRLDDVDVSERKYEINRMTSKPSKVIYKTNTTGVQLDARVNEIVAEMYYPSLYFLLCPYKSHINTTRRVKEMCEGMDKDSLISVLSKYCDKSYKEFYLYAQVSSDHRLINDNVKYVKFILENHRYHHTITKALYNENVLLSNNSSPSLSNKSLLNIMAKVKTWMLIVSAVTDKKIDLKHKNVKLYDRTIDLNVWENENVTENEAYNLIARSHKMLKECSKKGKILRNDLLDLEVFYTWKKPQARFAEGWVGGSEVYVKIKTLYLNMKISKDSIDSLTIYDPKKGSWDETTNTIFSLICKKMGLSSNMDFPNYQGRFYVGRHNVTGMLGYFEGSQCSTVYDTSFISDTSYFLDNFVSSRFYKRNKLPENVYYEAYTLNRKVYRYYSPIDLFEYSKDLKGLLDINLNDLKVSSWYEIVDCLVNFGLYDKKLTIEDVLNDFHSTTFNKVSLTAIEYMERKLNEGETCVDFFDKIADDNLLKANFLEEISRYYKEVSLKTHGYKGQANSILNKLIRNMDVDPRTLPEEIREIYLDRSYNIYLQGKMGDFCNDLEILILNSFDENISSRFLTKWGKRSLKTSLKIMQDKDLNVLINFEYITDLSTVKYYEETIYYLLEQLDFFYNLHFTDVINSINKFNPLKGLFSTSYSSKNTCHIRHYFMTALEANLGLDQNCISLWHLYTVVDAIFLDEDLLFAFTAMTQEIENTTPFALQLRKKKDPIFSRLRLIPETRFLIKEFISSYIRRYPRPPNKGRLDSLDDILRNFQLKTKMPDQYLFNKSHMAKNQTHHSKISVLDSFIDITSEVSKNLQASKNMEGDFLYFNPDNPSEIIRVIMPDEDDDEYDEFYDFVCESKGSLEIEIPEILESTIIDLRKSKLKYDKKKEKKESVICYYVSRLNFDVLDLPHLIRPGCIVILETNLFLDISELAKRNLACFAKRKVVNRNRDVDGLSLLYIFADLGRSAVRETIKNFDINVLHFDPTNLKNLAEINLNYKKINGKYVRVTRAVMSQTYDYLEIAQSERDNALDGTETYNKKKAINQKKDSSLGNDERLMSEYMQLLQSINLETSEEVEIFSLVDKTITKTQLTLFRNLLKNSKIDIRILNLIYASMEDNGKLISWKNVFKKYFKTSIDKVLNIFEVIGRNITKMDQSIILQRAYSGMVIEEVKKWEMSDLSKIPENVHVGSVNYNIFGYSSDFYNEFVMLIGEDVNGLLTNEIRLNSSTWKLLKSFCYTIKSKLEDLNVYNDEKFYENDYSMYTFFSTILASSKIDDSFENNNLRSFLMNAHSDYNVERTEYISKNYKNKKLRKISPKDLGSNIVSRFLKDLS